MSRVFAVGLLATLLAGCGADEGAPSAEQDREMEDAAKMLDEAPNSLSSIDDSGLIDPEREARQAPEAPAP